MKIAETFTSIQGEGHLSGKLMRFIRFAGCAVTQCPLHPTQSNLCDTDWRYREVADPERLANEAADEVGARGWVCITGGEPLDQPEALARLIAELGRRGLLVNIQTSGTRWVTNPWDWLTVSPKCKPDELVQTFGQELKVVYTGQSDDELRAFYTGSRFWNYYLMPLWAGGSHNVAQTIEAVKRLNRAGQPWELTTQAHKWWGVR
jgi:organic radical activating enzyme